MKFNLSVLLVSTVFWIGVVVIVFGLCFMGIGGIYFGFEALRIKYESRDWETTKGRILDIAYKEKGDPENLTKKYVIFVSYRFSVNGRDYIGDKYQIDDPYESFRDAVDLIVKKYPKGSLVSVYYDPQHPERCYLFRENAWWTYFCFIFGLFCFVALFRLSKEIRKFYGKDWNDVIKNFKGRPFYPSP